MYLLKLFIFYFTTARGFSNSITVLPLTSLLAKGEGNYRKTLGEGREVIETST